MSKLLPLLLKTYTIDELSTYPVLSSLLNECHLSKSVEEDLKVLLQHFMLVFQSKENLQRQLDYKLKTNLDPIKIGNQFYELKDEVKEELTSLKESIEKPKEVKIGKLDNFMYEEIPTIKSHIVTMSELFGMHRNIQVDIIHTLQKERNKYFDKCLILELNTLDFKHGTNLNNPKIEDIRYPIIIRYFDRVLYTNNMGKTFIFKDKYGDINV